MALTEHPVSYLCAFLAFPIACGCSTSKQGRESAGTSRAALTGAISFDSSCTTAPNPQTNPPADPTEVMQHLQIGEAYARIAASSVAFRDCMKMVISEPTVLGLPGSTWMSGPHYACAVDPDPGSDPDVVVANVLSSNGTLIACDYAAIGTNTGGWAFVPDIDSSGREVINVGNELTSLSVPADCNYNPDSAPCVDDYAYAALANTISHEIMHTHGYDHVGDAVWNLNDVNIGDLVGTPPDTRALTLGDFCGITPAYTPGNDGVAPTAPTSTPTPGIHPTYGSGLPYEVGQCIYTVLAWSAASGRMHDDCGPDFAGMELVDSVFSGDPSTATMECVADPYSGSGAAPIPPHAPTCTVSFGCWGQAATFACSDANANPVNLEWRASGADAWQTGVPNAYSAGLELRTCAVSLYGAACSTPAVVPPSPSCGHTCCPGGCASGRVCNSACRCVVPHL